MSVYGEHFQPVTGNSTDANVEDGELLDSGFVGKEIQARCEKHYEPDQIRSSSAAAGSADVAPLSVRQ